MPMGPSIRKAQPSDAPVICKYNINLGKETEDLELDERVVQQGVNALLSDPAKGCYFLLEDDGEVAAQLMITYEWSDWRNGQLWWIQSVYVHPRHRRRGHFRALYEYVKERARSENAVGIRLYVDVGNSKAQSTYKSMGMSSHYLVFEDMSVSSAEEP